MERSPGDCGEFSDAVDYAVDVIDATDAIRFLRDWREGALEHWPKFFEWLDAREAALRAERKADRARLKGFRIGPRPDAPSLPSRGDKT